MLHKRPNTFAQTCLIALSFFLAVGRRTIHIRIQGNIGVVHFRSTRRSHSRSDYGFAEMASDEKRLFTDLLKFNWPGEDATLQSAFEAHQSWCCCGSGRDDDFTAIQIVAIDE